MSAGAQVPSLLQHVVLALEPFVAHENASRAWPNIATAAPGDTTTDTTDTGDTLAANDVTLSDHAATSGAHLPTQTRSLLSSDLFFRRVEGSSVAALQSVTTAADQNDGISSNAAVHPAPVSTRVATHATTEATIPLFQQALDAS